MNKIVTIFVIGFLLLTTMVSVNAYNVAYRQMQENTSDAFGGYILYTNYMMGSKSYLLNSTKEVVNEWNFKSFGMDAHLLENGDLLRNFVWINSFFCFGGSTGGVQKFNWKGTLLWTFIYSNSRHCLHHDIEPLPNGNVLMIAWEQKTTNEAIDAGRNPNLINNGMIPDEIIEVKPRGIFGGDIVWEWHAWDHLVQDYDSTKNNYGIVANHPELIDINIVNTNPYEKDWMHTNSVDYNEEFDQILICVLGLGEIFVIDHSTTTKEAEGHTGGRYGKGGDLLYRWGNPQNYRAGNADDLKLFRQHDAEWVQPGCPGEGYITIFNTGAKSVDEIVPPVDVNGYYTLTPGEAYGPEDFTWRCPADGWSGAQRLPNGNTLMILNSSSFVIVTPEKNVIWQYDLQWPSDAWKIEYYPANYSGANSLSLNLKNVQSVQISQSNSSSQSGSQPSSQPSSQPISQQVSQQFNLLIQMMTKTTTI